MGGYKAKNTAGNRNIQRPEDNMERQQYKTGNKGACSYFKHVCSPGCMMYVAETRTITKEGEQCTKVFQMQCYKWLLNSSLTAPLINQSILNCV